MIISSEYYTGKTQDKAAVILTLTRSYKALQVWKTTQNDDAKSVVNQLTLLGICIRILRLIQKLNGFTVIHNVYYSTLSLVFWYKVLSKTKPVTIPLP